MEIQNNSMRSQLIQTVVNHQLPQFVWDDVSTLTRSLQSAFTSNLNFKIKVTDAEVLLEGYTRCQVSFVDEEGTSKVLDITVTRTGKIENEKNSN